MEGHESAGGGGEEVEVDNVDLEADHENLDAENENLEADRRSQAVGGGEGGSGQPGGDMELDDQSEDMSQNLLASQGYVGVTQITQEMTGFAQSLGVSGFSQAGGSESLLNTVGAVVGDDELEVEMTAQRIRAQLLQKDQDPGSSSSKPE